MSLSHQADNWKSRLPNSREFHPHSQIASQQNRLGWLRLRCPSWWVYPCIARGIAHRSDCRIHRSLWPEQFPSWPQLSRLLPTSHFHPDDGVQQWSSSMPMRLPRISQLWVRPIRWPVPVQVGSDRPSMQSLSNWLFRISRLSAMRLSFHSSLWSNVRFLHLSSSRHR